MGVNPNNLLAGVGVLYRAPVFGAAEPATITAAPAAPYVDLGGTQDGLTLNVSREFFELEVDQIVDSAGRRLTKRDVSLATNLAEATLENFAAVNNELATSVVSSGTGATALDTFEPTANVDAYNPNYAALIFDGMAPGFGKRRRVFARKVLSIESVESSYKKDGQVLFPVTWATHYVSPTVKPYAILDDKSPAV